MSRRCRSWPRWAGAAKLARARTLKHVDLAGTGVSEEGLKSLATALPDARVVGNEQ
jgi:hypothetical protein